MPSTSKKQHNFMAAVANNPKFAKKAGVPQSVGRDFTAADKGRTFSKGDSMKTTGKVKRMMGGGATAPAGMPAQANFGGAARGLDRAAAMSGRTMPTAGARPAVMPAAPMKKGGVATSLKAHAAAPASKAHAGMKCGGYVRAADGIALKGKTKGRMC